MHDSVSVLQRHTRLRLYTYAPLKRRHSAARSTCADVLGARFSPLGAGMVGCRRALHAKADGLGAADHFVCEGTQSVTKIPGGATPQRCGGSELEWLRAQATQAQPSQPHTIVALWCPCMRAVVWLIAAHVHTHPSAELKAVPYFALPFTP